MEIQQRLLTFITRTNWIVFVLASIAGWLLAPPDFARGVTFGGLLVTINFHLLHRTLKKSLNPPYRVSMSIPLIKFYLRFFVSGVIIFLLLYNHIVHPIGLVVGLSVVVASIFMATALEIKHMLVEEKMLVQDISASFGRVAYYGGMVMLMSLSVFAGLLIGYILDARVFHTTPWLTVAFVVIGAVAGFKCIALIIRKVRATDRTDEGSRSDGTI
jgi:hypothetical protein